MAVHPNVYGYKAIIPAPFFQFCWFIPTFSVIFQSSCHHDLSLWETQVPNSSTRAKQQKEKPAKSPYRFRL